MCVHPVALLRCAVELFSAGTILKKCRPSFIGSTPRTSPHIAGSGANEPENLLRTHPRRIIRKMSTHEFAANCWTFLTKERLIHRYGNAWHLRTPSPWGVCLCDFWYAAVELIVMIVAGLGLAYALVWGLT